MTPALTFTSLRNPASNRLLPAMLLAICALLASSCGTQRKATAARGGTVTLPERYYEDMREEIKEIDYTIPEITALMREAASWLGAPYKYGGNSRSGVDCSGMVVETFRKALNCTLPRSSREQYEACADIQSANLQPGDLVFFATGSNPKRISHVGLFIGNGEIIHSTTSRGVIVTKLSEDYWTKHFRCCGRPAVIAALYNAIRPSTPMSTTQSNSNSNQRTNPVQTPPSTINVPDEIVPDGSDIPSALPAIGIGGFFD